MQDIREDAKKKNIVFRVDSSTFLGSGHVMRCLTLADEMRRNGLEAFFICRELPGNICRVVEQKNYEVYKLPQNDNEPTNMETDGKTIWPDVSWNIDAEQTVDILKQLFIERAIDWLIVDHYGIDKQWESFMRPYVRKIMVIDDLANRPHDCDLLLDQNYYENAQVRYEGLVPESCQLLLGSSFALIRNEFKVARKEQKARTGKVERIAVFFGGSDPTNETKKTLHAIDQIGRIDISVDVIVGSSNPKLSEIRKLCSRMNQVAFYSQIENMAQILMKADLAIGAGGSSTWERCYLGIPTLTIIVAANQIETTRALANTGAIYNMGWHESVSVEDISRAINYALNHPQWVREMGNKAIRLMEKHTKLNLIINAMHKNQQERMPEGRVL